MKALAIAILVSPLACLLPTVANACKCVGQTPCEAFGEATAVFIARMVGGSERVETRTTPDGKKFVEAGKVRFFVEQTFKGSLGAEVTLSVNSNRNTSCGPYGLIRGESYLVYAYGNAGDLSTGVCTRTSLVSEADEDLQFLRSLPEPGTGGHLSGRVWADKREGGASPLAGVTVTIRNGENQTVKVVTDKEGEFALANLKPGKYKVEPKWPEHFTSERGEEEVTVSDRGCISVGFEAKLDGRVEGRVLDTDGRPASIMLHLEPLEPGKNRRSITGHSHEHESGVFEITGVPPGSYRLFFEFQTEGLKNNKKFYYPGVTDPKEAVAIKVGLGEKGGDLDFRIPSEFKARTIEGWVVWPDGSPAVGIQVMLLCPRSTRADGYTLEFGPPVDVTDEQGRFHLQGFKGTSYWLEARGDQTSPFKNRSVEMHSPPRPFTLQEDLIDVKLVLSAKGFSGGCGERPKANR